MCEIGRELITYTAMGAITGAVSGVLTSVVSSPGGLAGVTFRSIVGLVSGPVGVAGITVGAIVGGGVGCGLMLVNGQVKHEICKKIIIVAMVAIGLLGLVGAAWSLVGVMGFSVTLKNAAITTVIGGCLFIALAILKNCCEKCAKRR